MKFRIRRPDWPRSLWIWAGAVVLTFTGFVFLAQAGAIRQADPRMWQAPQLIGTALVILCCIGLYLQARVFYGRLDQAWDEVDELRAEVASLREELHQGHPVAAGPSEAEEDPTEGDGSLLGDLATTGTATSQIEQIPIEVHDTGPIARVDPGVYTPQRIRLSDGRFAMAQFSPRADTVTGIPSATPPVPPRTGSTAVGSRGRHAAPDTSAIEIPNQEQTA